MRFNLIINLLTGFFTLILIILALLENVWEESLHTSMINSLIIVLFICVISANYVVIREVSRPLTKLTALIGRITRGDVDSEIDKETLTLKNEVGDLAESLNRILVSFKLAIVRGGVSKSEMGLGEAVKAKEVAEKKYKLLFNKMIHGFALHKVILNNKGKVIDYEFIEVNPAFEKLTGLKREKIINKRVKETIPGIEKDWIEKYGKVALTQKDIKFKQYSKKLKKWYNVYAYSPEKEHFATIFEEIEEPKKKTRQGNFLNKFFDIKGW